MSWTITYIAHAVIVLGMFLLALYVLVTDLEREDQGETFARVILTMVGFLIYFAGKELVLSIPELMLSSIATFRPLTYYPLAVLLPSLAGVIVAAFVLRGLNRSDVRAKRAMVFVTTFLLVLFADIYATVFQAPGTPTIRDKLLLPNVIFIVALGLYIGFRYKSSGSHEGPPESGSGLRGLAQGYNSRQLAGALVLIAVLAGGVAFGIATGFEDSSSDTTAGTDSVGGASSLAVEAEGFLGSEADPPRPAATAEPAPLTTSTTASTTTTTVRPAPGTVLYEAGGDKGWEGWPSFNGWNVVGDLLVQDGMGGTSIIIAPFQPPVSDYAVEAEIQLIDRFPRAAGVLARVANETGYFGGFGRGAFETHEIVLGDVSYLRGIAEVDFEPGKDWHMYRLEVKGNNLRLFVDGAVIAQGQDNRYLSPESVGLLSDATQVSVRSFRVSAL